MEARNLCDKVVEEDDKCIKGYFRRGEALVALNEHALAMTDFEKVLELDADNKAAKNKVAMCVRQIKANKQKEKKTFANMFDKVSVCTFIYTYLLPTGNAFTAHYREVKKHTCAVCVLIGGVKGKIFLPSILQI